MDQFPVRAHAGHTETPLSTAFIASLLLLCACIHSRTLLGWIIPTKTLIYHQNRYNYMVITNPYCVPRTAKREYVAYLTKKAS